MNAEKLRRLQAQVRIGGKGTPRRKKKVMHQSAATDDKKLQSSLKKLSVSTIPGIEEVNIIKDDLTVIHFNNPKAQASLSANTFAVTGHGENKKIVEMLPEILPQLGQETVMQLRMFANTMSHGAAHKGAPVDNYMNGESVRKTASALDDDDDVPLLVNDFEQVAKLEEAATAVKTMKVVTFEADSAPDDHPLNAASNQFDKLVGNLDKCVEEEKVEVPITTTPLLSEVPTTNKIHNTKIQKTANECVKDEKKGNKKSNNKQQQKDQIDVHDMAAKNKTETIAEVVEVEDKKAKQMKIEKPIGQQQEVKALAAPLIVSDNVKNNKKEKQDKQKKEISLKGENKMKEAKVAGKFSVQISNDNERKVKGKKDKENFESNKCGQDAKVKEKQMKSKDTTNELSKLAKKDKKATTEENKSIKKNNMELIREKDINKDKENQSTSVEVNKKVESLKEGGKKEQLKVENKHQAIGEMSKDQIGKMEKEAVVKKEEQPIAASKVETVSTNEITQVKGTIDLSKAEKETIQGERKGFQEISSDTGAKNLSLDISSKSNSQLGVDSTPPKFKENDVKIKSVSDEKLADGSQKEKLKPKNDVATKKAANKEGVIATAKEKGKDLKLDINTSKQADMAASKGPQSKTAPILEGQRSSKVQTTNKEPTSAKTLENLNTTSKARKQSKEVIPKVRSPGIATTITTTMNTPTTEPKIIDDSNTAPVTGLMSASQELPENIEKKELSNVPSVPTRNSPNVTQKSNANAKSKTAEKQPQYAHGGVEKPPSKQSPSKSTVLPKSITSAVAKTSTKSEKQKMPSKAATDITPKLLQQPKNESTYTLNPVLTTPSVDSTDTTKDLESSNLAQKPVQSQEMSKEAPQAATAKINTNVSEVKSLQKTITTSEQTQQIMTTKSDIRKAPEQDMQISLSTSNVESKSSRQPTMKTNEKSKSSKQHQVKVSKISADKVQDADINEKALEELLTKIKNQENTAAHSTKNVSPTPLMEQLPVALSTPETGVKLEEKNEEVTVSTVSIVSVKTEPTALLVPLGEATTQQEAKYENRKSLETQVQESLSTLTIDKQEMGKLIQPLAQQQSNVPKSTDDATLSTNEVKIPSQFAISEIVAKKPPETSTVLDDQVKQQIASEKIVTQLQADNQCLPISEVNIQSPVQGLSLPSQVIGPIGEAQSEVCNPGNPLDKLQMSIVSAPLNASQPCAQIIQQMAFPNIIVEVSKQQSTYETKEAVRTEDQILEMPCGESKSVQMDAKSSLSKDLILPEAQTTLNQNIPKVELNVCTPEVQDSKQLVDQQKEQQTQRKHQQQQHQQKQQQ